MARKTPTKIGPHIEKRRQRYYARLNVPKDVQDALGRKRFIETLGTDSPAEARRRAPALIAKWQAEIKAARHGAAGPLEADLEFYRRAFGPALSVADPEWIAGRRKALAAAKTPDEREAIIEGILNFVDGLVPEDDAEEPAAVETAKSVYQMATGELSAADATDAKLKEWLSTQDNEAKTIDLKRQAVRELSERFPTLSEITRREVQKYCEELLQKRGLARATVNRTLSAWRGYWKYLRALEAVPEDAAPFTDLSLPNGSKRGARATQRQPFEPADLVKLVTAAEAKGDQTLADLIRLGMYTGARIEELCALTVDRVNLSKGYLEITDAKTAAGWRQVPIHPELKPLLQRLCGNRKSGRVLADLRPNKYGDYSNAIGKRFGRLKSGLGFGRQHVFHSIRRTVVTLLENAGVPENVVADIVGHEKPTMTYGLYSGGSSLAVKARAIRKLRYPKEAKR